MYCHTTGNAELFVSLKNLVDSAKLLQGIKKFNPLFTNITTVNFLVPTLFLGSSVQNSERKLPSNFC